MEFKHITSELNKNHQLKGSLRSNFAQKQSDTRQPDVEKIKNEARHEVQQEFRKKTSKYRTRFELKFERKNTNFSLSLTKNS